MWKISEFLSEYFQFLVVKFTMYLNRRVFVMILCLQRENNRHPMYRLLRVISFQYASIVDKQKHIYPKYWYKKVTIIRVDADKKNSKKIHLIWFLTFRTSRHKKLGQYIPWKWLFNFHHCADYSFFFTDNRRWHFIDMAKSIFADKRENISKWCLLELLPIMLSRLSNAFGKSV